jgi:hypothetical protein
MALILPQGTDLLSADNHAYLHRVIATDSAAPEQSLIVNSDGSTNFKYEFVAKTGSYSAQPTDAVIEATSGTFQVTLPTAVGAAGKMYFIKNSGTGTITVATTSAQTIDGGATAVLSTQYSSLSVISDGTNWIVV